MSHSSPYQKPIADFLQLLNDSGVISSDYQEQAQVIAQDYLEQNSDFINIIWHIDDVQHIASNLNLQLTDEDCLDVLDSLESHHDANYGISWDSIECAINSLGLH